MSLFIGIDIGSTTLKIAGIDKNGDLKPIKIKYLLSNKPLYETLLNAFTDYTKEYGRAGYVGVTGSGQKLGAYVLGANLTATEIIAHAKGSVFLADKLNLPIPKTIIEIGGQDSKLILLKDRLPAFFNMNSICSAGTGEFLRHTIEEQSLTFDEFNTAVLKADRAENLEDICTVFARRSFRHAGQNGVPLDVRLKGLALAILRNYLRTVAKNYALGTSQNFEAPIFFLGGLSNCSAIALTLAELLGHTVYVPPHSQGIGALGMAALAMEQQKKSYIKSQNRLTKDSYKIESGYCMGCVNNCELTMIQSKNSTYYLGGRCEGAGKAGLSTTVSIPIPTIPKKVLPKKLVIPLPDKKAWAVGLDAGSRQLKAALLYGSEVVFLHTETTDANLYKQALRILSILKSHLPENNTPFYLKTTGSGGRFLSQKLVGDESLYETEILCHYRAAYRLFPDVGTVIDVGGNDSKIIIASNANLEFSMNDRCAAGTGSFLEQLAMRFDLSLEEAANLALESDKPARIGSRCAVLAETDIVHKMRLGALIKDLLLGACYALAKTFISDTMHGKTLVTPVVFQGGAFLNSALLLAFTKLLSLSKDEYHVAEDKRYLVGAGAIGAAIYALEALQPFRQKENLTEKEYSLAGVNV